MDEAERARELVRRLRRAYPGARCALVHRDAFQLLVATILSAQCTDRVVNEVASRLFARYPTPGSLAEAEPAEVEAIVRPAGLGPTKARHVVGSARRIVEDHGGRVPATMEGLLALPGVGRKTANVVLGNALGVASGVVVDTHVLRLARRLGLSSGRTPASVERDLMALVPRKDWVLLPHLLIRHGRAVCRARGPRCGGCVLAELCERAGAEGASERQGRGKRRG